MTKKFLLFQPHSDDVLFSASKFLFDDEAEITLFTLEKNQDRLKEDRILQEFFPNIKKIISTVVDYEDNSYYTFYKELKEKEFNAEAAQEVVEYDFEEILPNLKKQIDNTIKVFKANGYKIIAPLGVGHPMHFWLSEQLKKHADLFYRDWPHSYKRKAKNFMKERLNEFVLKESFFDDELHELKFEIAYQTYKSQRSLMFFEKGYIDKKLPEEFYIFKNKVI